MNIGIVLSFIFSMLVFLAAGNSRHIPNRVSIPLTFLLLFIGTKIFGREIPYWMIIIAWGILNYAISSIKMQKLLRLFLYALSFTAIFFISGLKLVIAPGGPTIWSFTLTVVFFLFNMYLFSFLSELSGFSNGIFFIISLSLFVGLKFIIGIETEELMLVAFMLGVSLGIFIFEMANPDYRLNRADGKFMGFMVSLISISANAKTIFFETVVIPLSALLIIVAVYFGVMFSNFRRKMNRHEGGYIVKYSRFDIFLFVYFLLITVSLIGIFLKEIGIPRYVALIISLIFIVMNYILFRKFLHAKKVAVKENEPVVKILGISIDNLSMDQTVDLIKNAVQNSEKMFVATVNPVMIINALENRRFAAALDSALIKIPDGIGVVFAADFLGIPLKERVPGIEVIERILNDPPKKNMKVLMFGSARGTAKKFRDQMREKFRQSCTDCEVRDSGGIDFTVKDGYLTYQEREALRRELRSGETGYDLILVALGSPSQELWIANELEVVEKGVFIGVGGSFDVLSGNKKRASESMRKQGFEWVIRIMQEPFKRIPQIGQITNFILKVVIERIGDF